MSLRIQNLCHTYSAPNLPDRTVLDIERWKIGDGAQILLRGVSGSGKTTLLNILAGLLTPTQGEVWLGEQSLYALGEAARDRFRTTRIGYVFQTHHLLPMLSAQENVEMPMAFAGHTRKQRSARAQELLAQLGLADFARNRPGQLSTGQRLRVAVARALANRPQLLLADEPTAALDPSAGTTTVDLLQDICSQENATLILCSHDPSLDSRFAEVYDLVQGHLTRMKK